MLEFGTLREESRSFLESMLGALSNRGSYVMMFFNKFLLGIGRSHASVVIIYGRIPL